MVSVSRVKPMTLVVASLALVGCLLAIPSLAAGEGKVVLQFHKDAFEEQPGYYTVAASLYTVRISEQGRIASVKLGELDLSQDGILIGLRGGRE